LAPLPAIGLSSKVMVASWYGKVHEGRKTASGDTFRKAAFTAAHRTAKFGTRFLVFYQGQMVEVRINDRGPFSRKRGRFTRDLDLSEGAARTLGITAAGVARVLVREVVVPEAAVHLETLLPEFPRREPFLERASVMEPPKIVIPPAPDL
jgi:rare lipoprotein A